MKTKEIIKNIEEVQFTDICDIDGFTFLSKEDFEKLDEVQCKETNPRRDYLGTEYVYHNSEDDGYFLVEFYGNDMGHEIYKFYEVEKHTEMKEVTTYTKI